MNYLAHVYLADNRDEKSVLGNFLGDFVNITTEKAFEDTVRKGIHMHRKIDTYTDKHPVFQASRRRISRQNRRFAGVLVDLFYDHFLAKNWALFCDIPLERYADLFYGILVRHEKILPERVRGMLPYIIKENWLVQYGELAGIEKPLERIAGRFARTRHPLICPMDELIRNYDSLEEDFKVFFPQAIVYAKQIRKL